MPFPFAAAAAALTGGAAIKNAFWPNRPSASPVDWIKPNRAEKAGQAAAIFGPGNGYDLGLGGMTQGGGFLSGQRQSQSQSSPWNPLRNPYLKYRGTGTGSQPSTGGQPQRSGGGGFDAGKAFTGMFNDPSYRISYSGGQPTTRNEKDFSGVQAAGQDKSPGYWGSSYEAFQNGQVPYDHQKEFQGVGQGAYNTGLTTEAQSIGQLQDLITNMFNTGNASRDAGIKRTGDLNAITTANRDQFGNFFNKNANDFSGFSNAGGYLSAGDKYAGQAADTAGRAANEAGTNINTARNITGRALSQSDIINDFVSQRFNKTDELLNQIQGGNVSAEERALIEEVYNKNKAALDEDTNTGAAAQKYQQEIIDQKSSAERRGLSGDSSPLANAVADVQKRRESEYNQQANKLSADMAAQLLGVASENRQNVIQGANIANQGATSFAQTGKGLLDTGVSGVGAANDSAGVINNAANTLAALDRTQVDKANAATNSEAEKQKAISNAGTLLLGGQQEARAGQTAVNETGRQSEQDFQNVLKSIQDAVSGKASIGSDMSKQGLEGDAQGFNEIMSMLGMLSGNRKDKLTLAIGNALREAGMGGSAG